MCHCHLLQLSQPQPQTGSVLARSLNDNVPLPWARLPLPVSEEAELESSLRIVHPELRHHTAVVLWVLARQELIFIPRLHDTATRRQL